MADENRDHVSVARSRPDDVSAQIAAAYACDRIGDETLAVTFYDAAWRLGVPTAASAEFIIGYGSTLRNVGRTDEALALLSSFLKGNPDDHAARCFYALALHSAGRHASAMAEMLDIALSLREGSSELKRYQRALTEYRDDLRATSGV